MLLTKEQRLTLINLCEEIISLPNSQYIKLTYSFDNGRDYSSTQFRLETNEKSFSFGDWIDRYTFEEVEQHLKNILNIL